MIRLTTQQIENLPEWMTIPDYPSYEVNCREGIIRNARTLRALKSYPDSEGYPRVGLYKDGRFYVKTTHRLVATTAFSYNCIQTDGLLVMHLDEERWDARIDNLAIGTNKENLNFPKAKQRCSKRAKNISEETRKKMSESHKGKRLSAEARKKLSEANQGEKNYWFGKRRSAEARKKMADAHPKKPVGAYKNGELILAFESTKEAGRNGFHGGAVRACCRGERRVHKGYEWKHL